MHKKHKQYLKQIGVSDVFFADLVGIDHAIQRATQLDKPQFSGFINPEVCEIALAMFNSCALKYKSFGGYEQAESRVIGFYNQTDHLSVEDFPIVLIKSKYNSKYGVIRHADVLGALLSTGIERKLFGDIIISDKAVQIFALSGIADFICNTLIKVRNQGVQFTKENHNKLETIESAFNQVRCSVSSMRVDALISAVYHVSRSQSQHLIKSGFVKVNYKLCEKSDILLKPSDLLSVRKHGRFYLDDVLGVSKKGKTRIVGRMPKE